MALQDEIERQAAQIRTDSYSMSIGELLNLSGTMNLISTRSFSECIGGQTLKKPS